MFTHFDLLKFRWFNVLLLLALLVGAAGITPAQASGGVLYVKTTATGTGDCLSWANACTLQTALGMSGPANPIWVKQGTYKPTTGYDRSATFQLRPGGAVYGGFNGTETSLSQRDFVTNVTTLSGFLSPITGNSYHVVLGAEGATLDGFTVSFGQADIAFPNSRGGGMYNDSVSPILRNLIFHYNKATYGGGLYNFACSPTLENVTFEENSAYTYGGGIANNESNPALTDVTFNNNEATGDIETFGGGMYSRGESVPTLTDVTFDGNSADYGGGMYNLNSHSVLLDVTFNENSAGEAGGGLANDNLSNATLTKVIFSGNHANKSGGGMVNYASDPILKDVTFDQNYAEVFGQGGGMYNSSGSPTLDNVTFSGNSSCYGGGMYNAGGNPTLTNVTFSGNSVSQEASTVGGFGGGMYNSGGNSTLINATFNANHANSIYITNGYGGGVFNTDDGTLAITNAVFWGNTADSGGPQLYNDNSTLDINYSVIEGGYPSGAHNLTADPKLGTLGEHGGFTQTIPLLTGSSAIDSGDDAVCPLTDQRGQLRPWDGDGSGTATCDMGAYEVPNPSPVFMDVPVGYWALSHIESLYANGITGGCGSGNYCPTNPVTRAQMAVFLLKSRHGNTYLPPDATGAIFNDVPADHMFAKWIEAMASEGITGGCGGGNYCPNSPVTRDQMAVFLLVAEHGSRYTPPAATGIFKDVPADNPFASWIEALYNEGVTGGCGNDNYCPSTVVTRGQMAVFLVAAFNLP